MRSVWKFIKSLVEAAPPSPTPYGTMRGGAFGLRVPIMTPPPEGWNGDRSQVSERHAAGRIELLRSSAIAKDQNSGRRTVSHAPRRPEASLGYEAVAASHEAVATSNEILENVNRSAREVNRATSAAVAASYEILHYI